MDVTPVFVSEEIVVARGDTTYAVEVRGVATFSVPHDGATIALLRREPDVTDELVEIVRAHYVAPRVHQLRGLPTLHAGVATRGDRAVALLGLSGAGKSTLASHLAIGGAFLGDDALLLRARPGGFDALPSSGHARLRAGSARHFGAAEVEGAPWDRFVQRFDGAEASPLARLYLLDEAPEIAITALPTRDGLLALARFVHRLDPTEPRLLARELGLLEALARSPGVRRLAFPRRFDALDEVAAAVDRDLASEVLAP